MKIIDNFINKLIDKRLNELKKDKEKAEEKAEYFEKDEDIQKYIKLSIQRTRKDFSIEGNQAQDGIKDDELDNIYNFNTNVKKIIFTHFAKQNFIGYQNCALLNQNWLINKCCCVPNDDAIKNEYSISFNENADIDKEIIKEIKFISDDKKKFNIKETCRQFGINKRVFGYGLCVPIFNDYVDMSVPFNIDALKKNSYIGMSIVDPYWITPVFDNKSQADPVSKDFYYPTYYKMPNGELIHKSWFIWNTYGIVPDILKPTYFYGGYPLTQLLYERVYCAEKVANEAHMLAMSKRLLVMDSNMNKLMLNPNEIKKQADYITYFRDNWGVAVKDRENNITQLDTSLADFDALLMTQLQLIASIADIPSTKLFNTQPKGFNTTGEYEYKQYNELLLQIQENDFIPILEKHYQLLLKSKYNIKENVNVKFEPFENKKEINEMNNTKAQYYNTLIDSGIISQEEARKNLINDLNSGFNDLEEIKEDKEEENIFNDLEEEEKEEDKENEK